MNLLDVQKLALAQMAKFGLIERGWTLCWSRKWFRVMGRCQYDRQIIWLAERSMVLQDEAQVKDTILHEIAHALVGPGHGHGPVWRACAELIGAVPEATCSTAKVVYKELQASCPSCGTKFRRRSRPRRKLCCGICHENGFGHIVLQWERMHS